MSCAPRHTPSTGRCSSMAARMNRFSAASQGYSCSSFTLIGPPIATTRSTSAGGGSSSVS